MNKSKSNQQQTDAGIGFLTSNKTIELEARALAGSDRLGVEEVTARYREVGGGLSRSVGGEWLWRSGREGRGRGSGLGEWHAVGRWEAA